MGKDTTLYAMLGVIIVLLLVSIFIQLRQQDDNLTALATLKSKEIHTFFADCRSNGGVVDVRPNTAPAIVFVCDYLGEMVEYTLSPGK